MSGAERDRPSGDALAPAAPHRLYGELAPWWPLVSDPADYAEEGTLYGELLATHGAPREVLELGSGGGHLAGHLKRRYVMTLSDVSEDMLRVSTRAHPECDHVLGDMRSLRLGARFDAVLLHDALSYLLTEQDLRAALATARAHCVDGGTVLCVPDALAETHAPSTSAGGGDDATRAARYLQWTGPLQRDGARYDVDFAFLLRDGDGPVRVVHDTHRCAAHPRARWLDACAAAGLVPEERRVTLHDPDATTVTLFVCRA